MKLRINGTEYGVESVYSGGYLDLLELDDGTSWYVARSSEAAGIVARNYWEELANYDPREFTCLIGEETLIQWGLGNIASPGSTPVSSLDDWLDLWLDTPEEQWANYDGTEADVSDVSSELAEDLGYTPTVAYRHN